MAFGGGTGGFSFGSSNNNNQSTGFGSGGFGSNTNTNTSTGFGSGSTFGSGGTNNAFGNSSGGGAFGASSSGGAFGNNNTTGSSIFGANKTNTFGSTTPASGGGLFGNQTNTSTNTTGFGASGGAFGSTNTNAFGSNATPSTGGAFGGFGNNASNNTTAGFGTSQNKPLFGSQGTGTTGGAFGSPGSAFSALGNNNLSPCSGTDQLAFQPTVEKEANGSASNYQTITFQQPYQKYSLEELRLADYEKGHQFGNSGGAAGAFGATNFGSGAFGATNTGGAFGSNTNTGGGLFGNTSTSGGAFGSQTATSGGAFGSSSGGGLFGQNKPATGGGLFGQQTSSGTTSGLFGTSNNTSTPAFGGFGQQNQTQNQPATGGLFGQNKPATGSLFGNSGTTGTTGTTGFSFGNQQQQSNTPQTGGLFGSGNTGTNTGGGLFGNNTNTQSNTTGGLFGSTGTQNQSGGLFGNNKPAGAFGTSTTQGSTSGGLFGNTGTNTGGGLFGNTQQQQNNTTGGGIFGNNNNNQQQQGGGIFGQTQNKPAGGLFGGTSTNTGGGLFGQNNNNNQQQSGGLFGNNQQPQQQGGGLFGGTSTTGGGLFSMNNNQNKPGGLFNNSTTNNNQGGGLFGGGTSGGLFNQSQNQQQQQFSTQQEVKHASLLDPNPYGQSSIWTGLPNPTPENSKPVFTPLTATKKLEESARKPLPTMRLNQSRYMTPPRRNGFGFSYSTYGTPSSVASTPGAAPLSGSMYGSRGWSGGSFGRSFNRSASVQNLRSQYANDADDIWKPNAFAPSHRNSSGSIKRLTIDRSIRQDLFNRPPAVPSLPAPKPDTNGESNQQPRISGGGGETQKKLSKRVSFEHDNQETTLNSESGAVARIEDHDDEEEPPRRNGASKDLQAVPEDRESHQVTSKLRKPNPEQDPEPGEYWMKPSKAEIQKMPTDQKKNFKGFQVGRQGCGYVVFDGTVDLSAIDLDNLYNELVQIRVRSVTVYPDSSKTPAAGRGLNVPSTITIENSWPRKHGKPIADTSGPEYDKHIRRLKRVPDTEFISYNAQTGGWVFKVAHYTRYGLDYDDDGESLMDQSQSELSLPPHAIEKSADASVMEVDEEESDDNDDTFAFKQSVPGQFGRGSIIPADEDTELASDQEHEQYDDGSEQSAVSEEDMMSEDEPSPQMPGSMPQPPEPFLLSPTKAPTKLVGPGTPGKPLLDLEGDWAEQLQRTISPRKQNRDVLREAQSKVILDKAFSPIKPKAASQVNFRSSIDIMNSMFKPASNKKASKAAEPDFEFPYSKRPKTFHPDDEEMSEQDRRWHDSFKPHFTTSGKIMYRVTKLQKERGWKEVPIAGDGQNVVAVGRPQEGKAFDLDDMLATSKISPEDGVPAVEHQPLTFSQLVEKVQDKEVVTVYNLAHVLFDEYEDEFTLGLSKPMQKKYAHRIRRDRVTRFLSEHILSTIGADELKKIEQVSPLKAVLLRLSAYDIHGACELLKKSRNLRLLLLVSQLKGANEMFMSDMKAQIDAWRDQKSLSEFDCDIRTLYELCAGNVTVSQGREGPKVPVEDRAETFTISTRYGLSWLQCFALGLFYGRQEKNNSEGIGKIEDAVREFQARCDRGEEPTKPSENDVMWSLLKLYASQHDNAITAPQFPAALSGLARPWDHTALFAFQQACAANLTISTDATKADELSETLAAELSSQGDLASAIYALVHISSASVRKSLIQDLLDRFAATLPGSDTATSDSGIALWQRLTMDLKVPTAWVYMSKARYAASATNQGGDNVAELRYLVAAESWDEAHECLVRRVAPALVVDEDYQDLLEMCKLFGDEPARRVGGWHEGGEVFATFGQLMTGFVAKTDAATISSLRKRLVTMGHKQQHGKGKGQKVRLGQLSQHELEEHVAIREMSNALAKLSTQGGVVGSLKEIQDLPLTQDVRMEVTMSAGEPVSSTSNSTEATARSTSRRTTRGRGRGLGLTNTPDDDAMDQDEPAANGSNA